MDDLLSEKEQIEQMRTWWSEYGNYVIGGIVLGAMVLFGINHVRISKIEAQQAASILYDDLTTFVVDGNADEAEIIVATSGKVDGSRRGRLGRSDRDRGNRRRSLE